MKESQMFEMDRKLQIAQNKYDNKKGKYVKAKITLYLNGEKKAIDKYYDYIIGTPKLRVYVDTKYYRNGSVQDFYGFDITKSNIESQ